MSGEFTQETLQEALQEARQAVLTKTAAVNAAWSELMQLEYERARARNRVHLAIMALVCLPDEARRP